MRLIDDCAILIPSGVSISCLRLCLDIKIFQLFKASTPVRIIKNGIPTDALLAQIHVARNADSLLLYRQEAIYAREKVALDQVLVVQWMGRVDFELKSLGKFLPL